MTEDTGLRNLHSIGGVHTAPYINPAIMNIENEDVKLKL